MNHKNQVLHRIKIAQGHLEKVKQMLEDDCYCPDIIHQSQAVQAALKKSDELILQGHLETCVFGEGNKNKMVDKKTMAKEILEVFKKGVR